MKINDSSLKEILIKAKNQSDVVTDLKAQELIEGALEKLDKLPETLTKLQLLLDKDPDKWAGAGETLSLTNF